MTSDSPQVSIIMPTYNRAGFLGTAIESVLAQTMPDWELLIVDDGSTDDTEQVLDSYKSDPRIRCLRQSNQGQAIARNKALSLARGQFVGFLDSDDTWFENKLDKQLAVFRSRSDVGIVHGDEVTIDEQGREISRKNMRRYSGWITPQLLADNSVSITTALVRRECFKALGGFNERLGVADDYELWLRLSTRYTFHYEPGYVAAYRVMVDQISSDKHRRFEVNERIINDFLSHYGRYLTARERRQGLARFHARKARYFAMIGEARLAWSAISRALRLAPTSPLIWRAAYRVFRPRGQA